MVSDWVMRLRSLVRKQTIDRDLDDEMAFHLEQHVAASLARGISQSEALRLARIEFGGVQQIKEEHRDARGISLVTDFGRDVRYALNTFRQLPAFTVLALLILAFGIAATTVMFAVINGVLVRPLPYPDAQHLVSVRASTESFGELWGFSYPDFVDLKQESRSLSVAAWRYAGGTIEAPGEAAYVDAREISAELFSVLGLSLERGRAFHSEEDRPGATPVAVISYSLWQRRFGGTTGVVGGALTFEGKQYTIAGVAPAGFALNGEAEVFTPLGQNTDVRMRNR